jgi:hypothetical protein
MKSTIPALAAALAVAGCASPPPLHFTPAHPASPDAPEGAPAEHHSSLSADEATRKTRALISAAEHEQSKPDASPQTKNVNN